MIRVIRPRVQRRALLALATLQAEPHLPLPAEAAAVPVTRPRLVDGQQPRGPVKREPGQVALGVGPHGAVVRHVAREEGRAAARRHRRARRLVRERRVLQRKVGQGVLEPRRAHGHPLVAVLEARHAPEQRRRRRRRAHHVRCPGERLPGQCERYERGCREVHFRGGECAAYLYKSGGFGRWESMVYGRDIFTLKG